MSAHFDREMSIFVDRLVSFSTKLSVLLRNDDSNKFKNFMCTFIDVFKSMYFFVKTLGCQNVGCAHGVKN